MLKTPTVSSLHTGPYCEMITPDEAPLLFGTCTRYCCDSGLFSSDLYEKFISIPFSGFAWQESWYELLQTYGLCVLYIYLCVCVCVLDDLFEIVHFQCCLSCTAPLRTKQTRMTQWGKRKERKDPVVNKVLYVALLKLQPRFKCLMVHIVIRWHTKM